MAVPSVSAAIVQSLIRLCPLAPLDHWRRWRPFSASMTSRRSASSSSCPDQIGHTAVAGRQRRRGDEGRRPPAVRPDHCRLPDAQATGLDLLGSPGKGGVPDPGHHHDGLFHHRARRHFDQDRRHRLSDQADPRRNARDRGEPGARGDASRRRRTRPSGARSSRCARPAADRARALRSGGCMERVSTVAPTQRHGAAPG